MSLLDDAPCLHDILLLFMRYVSENQWLALRESQQVRDLEADALIPRLFESRTPPVCRILARARRIMATNSTTASAARSAF
jgi:hypothetical protein